MKLYKLWAKCVLAAASLSYVVGQTQIDLRTQAKRVDFSNAGSTKPSKTGIVLPALCTAGETFLKLDAKPGANLYVCTAANVWSVQGSSLPEYVAGSYGKVLTNDDAGLGWESLGGDVTGTPDDLIVGRLQGRPVAPAPPSSGHVLSWDGTQWSARPVPVPVLIGDVTTSAGSSVTTLSSVNGAPGTCGDATHVCQVTTNAKGLVTQQTPVAVSASGGGINALNGLSSGNQNFVNDSNVTISSAGSNHTLGWNGLLGLARGGSNSDLSNTGGAHQVLRQSSAGAPLTVGQLTAGDISGLAASATTDATNASNISSGTLPNARLSAVPNTALANSSLTVVAGNGLSGGGAAALGGSVTLNAVMAVNAQAGASYTVVAGDSGKLVTFNRGSAVSVTLPQATGAFGAGWNVRLRNLGAGAVTITPVVSTIDGAGSLALQTGQGVEIASDGTNYQTWRGYTWQPSAAGNHQFATGISAAGVVSYAQPAAAEITGLAASATTDVTNASNITAGTLGAARMPQFTGGQVTSPAAGSAVLNIGTAAITNAMLAGSIDASSKFTGITPATNGGTGNGFTAFTGPAGSVKTYTLPNVSTTIVTTQDTGSVSNGMLAGSIATSKLASRQGSGANVLTSGTVGGATGTPLCTDAGGAATTSGCATGAGTVTVSAGGNLASTALVTGGGSQVLQTPAATATMDSSGNIQTPGTVQAGLGSSNAGAWAFIQGSGTTAPANSVGFQAPTSVPTGYRITLPSAPAAGVVVRTNATPSVESIKPIQGNDANLLTSGTISGNTGDTLCLDSSGGATTSGCTAGGGGTSVNINGSSVSNPNFNATIPAAESSYVNVKFQVSSSSVSAEVLTNSANAVAGLDSSGRINLVQLPQDFVCSAAGASTTDYTCNLPAPPTGLVAGERYRFRADVANTAASGKPTITFNSFPTVKIVKVQNGVTTELEANDIRAGQYVDVIYDGTNMQMQSQLGNAAAGGGSMVYPGAGVPNSTGSAWGTSYAVGGANGLVQLDASGYLPALNASQLTNWPIFNQSTTGNAATATALADNAANCPVGQVAAGVDAAGAAEGCTASINGTAIPASKTLMATDTSLSSTQLPALTGDVTSSAGSAATTVKQVHNNVKALTVTDSPYSVAATDSFIQCDASGGAVTINLPATSASGREITIKKTDSTANACTPTRAGSDLIDGATTVSIAAQYATVKLLDRGTSMWSRTHVNQLTGDVTGTSTGNVIANSVVTLAKMADLANGKVICRTTAGTGVPEACTTVPTAAMPALTGDVTTSAGAVSTTIANGVITPAKSSASMNTDTWSFNLGTDNASADLVNADIGPQGRIFMVPVACTVSEITVAANAGTPSVIVRKNHAGAPTDLLSATLATGSAGAIACAATGAACADGTSKSGTVSVVTAGSAHVLAAGDWIETTSGVASFGAKRLSVAVTCVRN